MGIGSAVPAQIITNDQIALRVETNDEWVKTRTGIRERRILKDPLQATSDMAANALQKLLKK